MKHIYFGTERENLCCSLRKLCLGRRIPIIHLQGNKKSQLSVHFVKSKDNAWNFGCKKLFSQTHLFKSDLAKGWIHWFGGPESSLIRKSLRYFLLNPSPQNWNICKSSRPTDLEHSLHMGFSTLTLLTLGAWRFTVVGGCLVHCKICSSLHGLDPPDARRPHS